MTRARAATSDQIIEFVREQTGCDGPIEHETTLQDDCGVFGDDMAELVEAFAARFQVDMSGYLWYFHTGEETSFNPGALLFKPPYRRVAEIPITVQMLLDSANRGRWLITYPEHSIPPYRYDILVSQIVLWLLLLVLGGGWVARLVQ